jgi:hypothetical protein
LAQERSSLRIGGPALKIGGQAGKYNKRKRKDLCREKGLEKQILQ